MKYIGVLGAVCAICATSLSATAAADKSVDTVFCSTDVTRVVITESPSGINYIISNESDNAGDRPAEYVYFHEYKPNTRVNMHKSTQYQRINAQKIGGSRWSVLSGALGIGMVKALDAPSSLQFEMGKSFEIDWLYALGLSYRTPWHADINIGMGFLWRNFRSTVAPQRMIAADGLLQTTPWPDDSQSRWTALKTFSLQFPLIYRQGLGVRMFGSELKLGVGAVLGVSTYASVKSGWTDSDGRKIRQYTRGMDQRKVSIDFIATLQPSDWFGWYVRYSPETALDDKAGQPQFKGLAAGLLFLF